MLACVLTIAVGAASLLDTVRAMDRDLEVMNEQLAAANEGTKLLNVYLASMPRTNTNLEQVVATVEQTSSQVATSKQSVGKLSSATVTMNDSLAAIAKSTGSMRSALEATEGHTGVLGSKIDELDGKLGPLVTTQRQMLGETRRMQTGMCAMNGSLAYVLRQLNFMTSPPNGGGFTVRVELDRTSLPPVPGIAAKAAPVEVFTRGAWPIYNERGPAHAC